MLGLRRLIFVFAKVGPNHWIGQPLGLAMSRRQRAYRMAIHRVRFRLEAMTAFVLTVYRHSHLLRHHLSQPLREHGSGSTIKRLTARFVDRCQFRFLLLNEQRRIVAKIEELFSDLDAGVAALERAKAKLKRYRAAVLKAAVEGKLTEEWRAKHPPKETASQLLERILKERRRKWEEDQLAAYAKAGKKPPANWKDKYKEPAAPMRPTFQRCRKVGVGRRWNLLHRLDGGIHERISSCLPTARGNAVLLRQLATIQRGSASILAEMQSMLAEQASKSKLFDLSRATF